MYVFTEFYIFTYKRNIFFRLILRIFFRKFASKVLLLLFFFESPFVVFFFFNFIFCFFFSFLLFVMQIFNRAQKE